jgi:hypothetical protein
MLRTGASRPLVVKVLAGHVSPLHPTRATPLTAGRPQDTGPAQVRALRACPQPTKSPPRCAAAP